MLWIVGVFALIAGAAAWVLTFGPFRPIAPDAAAPPARPDVLLGFDGDAVAWRASLLSALNTHVYGPSPPPIAPTVTERKVIAMPLQGSVEQWRVELGAVGAFYLLLVTPRNATKAPVILVQTFCGNRAALPGRPREVAAPLKPYPCLCKSELIAPLWTAMLGECLFSPPFDLITEHGFALALTYGGDIVPDHPARAREALARFAPPECGAISAWAWMHSRAADVLSADPRIDPARLAVWGQSRNGKAALLAGARDERFKAVIALQAGRGGDALTQHRSGESVSSVMRMFPHWFTPRFAEYAHADPPVDQHQFLAAIAPRALLLGHALNDVWADPAGARGALRDASAAFTALKAPAPREYTRGGRHGIRLEDWRQTLAFLRERL